MRSLFVSAAVCAVLSAAAPASAAIRVIAQNYDLTTGQLAAGLDGANQIIFSFSSRFNFDFDPVLVQTTGTGAVTAFGGFLGIPLQPSTFFTRANVLVNANIFPGFASFPDATRIPGSLVASDLGLRVSIGGQDFFGYARFAGQNITVAFNDIAGAGINAGVVPEPASWAMMIIGFGAIGAAARTRRVSLKLA